MSDMSIVYARDVQSRPALLSAWEKHRHNSAHFLVEMVAEFLGVFLYVYAGWFIYGNHFRLNIIGLGSQAAYILGNIAKEPGLSCK